MDRTFCITAADSNLLPTFYTFVTRIVVDRTDSTFFRVPRRARGRSLDSWSLFEKLRLIRNLVCRGCVGFVCFGTFSRFFA